MTNPVRYALAPLLLLPVSCSEPAAVPDVTPEASAQDTFWQALSSHCGNAYAGGLVSQDGDDADMVGADMVMQVRDCSDDRIAIPFHIKEPGGDWNRSRTWVITRTDTGLRLKHDHRHRDGTSDAVTMYGGDTANDGDAAAQDFPVDNYSIAMFEAEGLSQSVTNTWRIEITPASDPDAMFAYQLSRPASEDRPAGRSFRVEFDASNPITAPPAPWGFEAAPQES